MELIGVGVWGGDGGGDVVVGWLWGGGGRNWARY